jgi:small subunit ribosomal protein S1
MVSPKKRIRIYDLAKELKLDTKRLIEEVRREGVDVSVPSNTVPREIAEKIRNKYSPKKESWLRRSIRVVKRATQPTAGEDTTLVPIAQPSLGDVDFGQLLDQFEQEQAALQEGEVVRGTVVGISERGVVIDFGYKVEGIVNPAEFNEDGILTVKPGDEVDVLVKSMETADGLPVLSRADAVRMKAWHDLEKSYRDGTNIKGRVSERIKGGFRVDIDGIAAFLPGSQVDTRPIRNLDSLLNLDIEAKIIKLNRKRSNVVLSRKAALEEVAQNMEGTLGQIEEGIIVEGQIKRITDYGAFVDLGGIDGLLHVTNMSWAYVKHPGELFSVGDLVQAKILSFDRERERISLGYKQLLPDPWQSAEERYSVGLQVSGRITRLIERGMLVEMEEGIEALLPVNEMTHFWRSQYASGNPEAVGQTVECLVTGLDPKNRRMTLSMREGLW